MPPLTTTPEQTPTHGVKLRHLLDAAARVFAAEGYDRASMRRVAAQAGVSLAGIYHYVGSKEELLTWIQLGTFRSLLEGLEHSLEGVVDPRERLEAAVRNHVRHFGERMDALRVCSRELETLQGQAHRDVYAVRRAYFRAVHELVRELTPGVGATTSSWLATVNLFAMLNWFYQWYDPARSPVSLDELATRQTALFLDGYLASVGPDDHPGEA